MNVKVGDQLRWVGGDGSYLKDKRVYTVMKIDRLGMIWFIKCDSSRCSARQLTNEGCTCRGWENNDLFEFVEGNPIVAVPTTEEIKQAKNLPTADDAALFFKRYT